MTARDGLKAASVAIDGIESVARLLGLGAPIDIVQAAIAAIQGGLDGTIPPGAVLLELAQLERSIEANDTAADKALGERFGK